MNKFENIIFDLDGTLIDSQTDIKESFKEAINKINGVTINNTSFRIGPPLEEIIRTHFHGISTEDEKRIVTTFRSIYANCGFNFTICYSGIEDLLLMLKQKNINIFLATNKPGYLVKIITEKLEINLFDDICTIDAVDGTFLSKKEMISLLIERNKLDHDFTLMIGDSISDIKSARENSITSIGVGYGYEEKKQILKENPDFYFDTVLELSDFLNEKTNK